MDYPALLAKIAGVVIFALNVYVIFFRKKKSVPQPESTLAKQSKAELALNTTLLYVWRAFVFVFSVGLVVNN
jgi:hypothetical protein